MLFQLAIDLKKGDAMFDVSKAVVVVAHSDDEILWFSPILAQCKHIIFCYGPSSSDFRITEGRRKVEETYLLKKVSFLNVQSLTPQ